MATNLALIGRSPIHYACVTDYNRLVILVHVMAAELVNTLKQAALNPQTRKQIASALEPVGQALEQEDLTLIAGSDTQATTDPQPDWTYAVNQLRESTQETITAWKRINTVPQ